MSVPPPFPPYLFPPQPSRSELLLMEGTAHLVRWEIWTHSMVPYPLIVSTRRLHKLSSLVTVLKPPPAARRPSSQGCRRVEETLAQQAISL